MRVSVLPSTTGLPAAPYRHHRPAKPVAFASTQQEFPVGLLPGPNPGTVMLDPDHYAEGVRACITSKRAWEAMQLIDAAARLEFMAMAVHAPEQFERLSGQPLHHEDRPPYGQGTAPAAPYTYNRVTYPNSAFNHHLQAVANHNPMKYYHSQLAHFLAREIPALAPIVYTVGKLETAAPINLKELWRLFNDGFAPLFNNPPSWVTPSS
ncbi:MAG: hypothetical protein KC474_00695 [Cyanobacteria bacterium HKST-UBA04]|nr:hypothetical protein [Cyanobacteria bacterium HKST-UBA04]